MIVWSGLGFLTALISFLSVAIFNSLLGQVPYRTSIGLLIAAAANWFLGKKLNGGEGRTLIDEDTGERIEIKNKHTLFWVKMEWWSIALAIFAIMMLFK